MARPRKPFSELSPDSVAHNKGLYAARSLEPKTFGQLGRPSKWLTPAEKKIWRTLLLSAPAVLGENDRPLMEITVCLKDKLEKRTCSNSEMKELINCLKHLGIVPKERKRTLVAV